jgi:hypothetical protein
MRIEPTVDALQGQAGQQQRMAAPPPATAPPRRVQAVGQVQYGEDKVNTTQPTPDNSVTLDLSPEGREAARKAAQQQSGRKEDKSADDGVFPPGHGQDDPSTDREVEQLRQRDRDVRAHEQAVRAAAGGLSASARYSYQVGPDGRLYVIESDVQFDTSEVPGDPEATLRKAEQLRKASQAPGDPSPQDRAVAAMAAAMAARARIELRAKVKGGDSSESPTPGATVKES